MHKFYTLIVLVGTVLTSGSCVGQNLIPNGGFDTITSCPNNQGVLNFASPWLSARGTCDLYNPCNTGQYGVPNNLVTTLAAKNGTGYAGFFATQGYFEVREYLYVPLRDSLKAGKQYCLSFYVCLATQYDSVAGDTLNDVAVNDLGAYFTNTPQTPDPYNFNHYPFAPQVKNSHTNILRDRKHWMQIAGSFTATGGEKYMMIGSFSDQASQDTTHLDYWNNYNTAYYLIDDVTLVDCSAGTPFTAQVTGVNQICSGHSTTLTASPSGGIPGYSYSWSNGLPASSSVIVSPVTTTTYTVTIKDNAGNSATQTYAVTVTSSPVASAGKDTAICSGHPASLTASGGGTYSWSNGASTAITSVSPGISTSYVVTVSNGACSSKDTVRVTVNPSPVASAGHDTTICQGDVALLNATGGGSYLWSTGATVPAVDVSPSVTTAYMVTVSNLACKSTASVTVHVIPGGNGPCTHTESVITAPNVFTPNGDGLNDVFEVNTRNIESLTGELYDRWGKLVYTLRGVTEKWDGTLNGGSEASDGTYYYIINATGSDGKSYSVKGFFELMR